MKIIILLLKLILMLRLKMLCLKTAALHLNKFKFKYVFVVKVKHGVDIKDAVLMLNILLLLVCETGLIIEDSFSCLANLYLHCFISEKIFMHSN